MSNLTAPPTRKQNLVAMTTSSALQPINVGIPTITAVAGLVLGASALLMIPVFILLWTAFTVAGVLFGDEAEKLVAARTQQREGRQLQMPQNIHPYVAKQLAGVKGAYDKLVVTVDESDHPLPELVGEAQSIMEFANLSAKRATALHGVLRDGDVGTLTNRIRTLRDKPQTPDTTALIEALENQVKNLQRAQAQIDAFDMQMERLTAELYGVRSSVVTTESISDQALDERLADDARMMRSRVEALNESMSL